MTKAAFRPQPVQGFIESDECLRSLQTHVQEIMRLQRIWQKIVPAGLAEASRIGQIDAGTISIYADHGAAATKLRQLVASITSALMQHGIAVSAVQIKVRTQAIPVRQCIVNKPRITPAGLQQLDSLQQQLEEGSLKNALSTLLDRHR
ncbi:MAG: DciA family protein [Burkholderiales bacterium]